MTMSDTLIGNEKKPEKTTVPGVESGQSIYTLI